MDPTALLPEKKAVEFNGMLKFERPSFVSRKMARQWILRRLEVLGLLEVKDWMVGVMGGIGWGFGVLLLDIYFFFKDLDMFFLLMILMH